MNSNATEGSVQIRLTPPTARNVRAVAALLQANEAASGGALTGEFPVAKVEQMLQSGTPVITAWVGEALWGVLFTAPPSAAAHVPVLAAMRHAWPGRADDYLYGPVCIAEAARGRGVLQRMYEALRRALPGRAAVLFITDDNIASQRAHARLGMQAVAAFDWEGRTCLVYTDAIGATPLP